MVKSAICASARALLSHLGEEHNISPRNKSIFSLFKVIIKATVFLFLKAGLSLVKGCVGKGSVSIQRDHESLSNGPLSIIRGENMQNAGFCV